MSWRLSNFYRLFHLTDLYLAVQRFLISPELDIHSPTGVDATIRRLGVGDCLTVNSTITSPCSIPAFSAGLPGTTSETRAPCFSFIPNDFASSGVISWMLTPNQPRVTCPFS